MSKIDHSFSGRDRDGRSTVSNNEDLAAAVALYRAQAGGTTRAMFVIPTQEQIMSRIDIAKKYIHAAQTGNQALLASLVSPEVVWHQPGNNRFSGTHRGLPALGAMLGSMMEVSRGTFSITRADHFMENGDWVAICLEFQGQREGARLAQSGVDLLRIEAGKIVEVRLFSSNQQEEDTFWGT